MLKRLEAPTMSKAFTKDEGEALGDAPSLPVGPPLPAGARNYVTPAGAGALREQLQLAQAAVEKLREQGGPVLVAARERLVFLQERLEATEVVVPPPGPEEQVRFGATIAIEDDAGRSRTVRIVGIDEADAARGAISWTSPLARALLGHRAGDEVELRTPQGVSRWEVLEVNY
jgi:transcription elongation factor GreB